MKTSIKPHLQLKTLRVASMNRTYHVIERVNSSKNSIDSKFYQKIFIVLISLSTILIFPESPKNLETLCKANYSNQICSVW